MRPWNERPQFWVLDGHEPRQADPLTWAQQFENSDRIVAETVTAHGARISTVFMGVDMNYRGIGPPLLFESLVFGGRHAGNGMRYATWAEAEAGHAAIVAEAEGLNN